MAHGFPLVRLFSHPHPAAHKLLLLLFFLLPSTPHFSSKNGKPFTVSHCEIMTPNEAKYVAGAYEPGHAPRMSEIQLEGSY